MSSVIGQGNRSFNKFSNENSVNRNWKERGRREVEKRGKRESSGKGERSREMRKDKVEKRGEKKEKKL